MREDKLLRSLGQYLHASDSGCAVLEGYLKSDEMLVYGAVGLTILLAIFGGPGYWTFGVALTIAAAMKVHARRKEIQQLLKSRKIFESCLETGGIEVHPIPGRDGVELRWAKETSK